MGQALDADEVVAALDTWTGSEVAVRVVAQGDDLLAVARGYLGHRSDEKKPALFWPLLTPDGHEHAERAGIYLHRDLFESAVLRDGAFVIELHQAGTILNLRRL